VTFQERVIEEKSELDTKLEKLNTFIGSDIYYSLAHAERVRLSKQVEVMKGYSNILAERIAAF
jgi:hypothetical protein